MNNFKGTWVWTNYQAVMLCVMCFVFGVFLGFVISIGS